MTSATDPRLLEPARYAVVGIDIGKSSHVAAAITRDGKRRRGTTSFPNTAGGVDRLEGALLKPLGGPRKLVVAMEATGHYWMNLYFRLTERGYACAVLNPIQTRVKFQSRLRKTKTDKLDAYSIAEVFRTGELRASRIPDEDTFALRLWTRQRWRLTQIIGDLRRHHRGLADQQFPELDSVISSPWMATGRALARETGLDPDEIQEREEEVRDLLRKASRGKLAPEKAEMILTSAKETIASGRAGQDLGLLVRTELKLIEFIESQRAEIDQELALRLETIESPLESIGLSVPIVATIHAESDPISDFPGPKQYVAYCGLDPSTFQSGNFNGTRSKISKRGSPFLRHALYLAALGHYRHIGALNRLYTKQRKRGRHHNDALVIVAAKLARITWRLLTDQRPFKARPPKRER